MNARFPAKIDIAADRVKIVFRPSVYKNEATMEETRQTDSTHDICIVMIAQQLRHYNVLHLKGVCVHAFDRASRHSRKRAMNANDSRAQLYRIA